MCCLQLGVLPLCHREGQRQRRSERDKGKIKVRDRHKGKTEKVRDRDKGKTEKVRDRGKGKTEERSETETV